MCVNVYVHVSRRVSVFGTVVMLEIQYVPDHVIRRVVDMYVYIYCASDLIDMPPVAAQAGGRLLYYKKQTSELADMYRHHRILHIQQVAGRYAGRQNACMQAGCGRETC